MLNKLSMEQAKILSLLARFDSKSNDMIVKKNNSSSGDSEEFQPQFWRTKDPKDGDRLE